MNVAYGAIAAFGLLLAIYAKLYHKKLRSPYYASLDAARLRRKRSHVYTPLGFTLFSCGFLLLLLGLFLLCQCEP